MKSVNLILSIVQQEKQRIDYMLAKYQEALIELPKGTISEKQVNGNTYYYLKYRSGKKIVSKYVGKREVEAMKQKIDKRRHIEAMMKALREERKLAERVLEGNR